MNGKLSSIALAAVLAGAGLTGCGGASDVGGTGSASAVTAALSVSAKEMEPQARTDTEHEREETASRFLVFLNQLRQLPALAPLFDQFGVPSPIVADDDARASGLIDLLHAVRFSLHDGTLTITNRATGAVIFTAPLADLAAGVLHPESLPGAAAPPPTGGGTCTSFTYSPWSACSASGTQTRTVLSSSPAGCTGGAPVLSGSCTPPAPVPGPVTCTSFTYSAWSACSASGTQTRTVLGSAPAGCTGGAPATSQACTPALDGAALYGTACSRCHGPLATSNLKGRSISLALIKQFNMTQGLTDAQLQAIVTAVGP